MPGPQIATCCYCGTRAALVLAGRDRHELSCGSCGAPLRSLKRLKRAAPARPKADKPHIRGKAAPTKHLHKRRKRPLGQRILHEIFEFVDDIEDIFD